MPTELERQFVAFEAELLANRYDWLKDRDYQNFLKHTKLFSFLIIYGAAPFLFDSPLSNNLLRAWGLGGTWLVITVLFYCDRDFRAYGLHLKERVYCLRQLAVLRQIAMGRNSGYRLNSLLPLGKFLKPAKSHHSFPERLSSGQLRAASYFFKFLGLFPLMYLAIFVMAFLSPGELLAQEASSIVVVLLMLAPVISSWLYFSFMRCLDLQRLGFEARRITSANPWPRFEKRELNEIFRSTKGVRFYRQSLWAMAVLSVACTAIFGATLLGKMNLMVDFEWADSILGVAFAVGMVAVWLLFFAGHDRFLTRVFERMGRVYEAQTGYSDVAN